MKPTVVSVLQAKWQYDRYRGTCFCKPKVFHRLWWSTDQKPTNVTDESKTYAQNEWSQRWLIIKLPVIFLSHQRRNFLWIASCMVRNHLQCDLTTSSISFQLIVELRVVEGQTAVSREELNWWHYVKRTERYLECLFIILVEVVSKLFIDQLSNSDDLSTSVENWHTQDILGNKSSFLWTFCKALSGGMLLQHQLFDWNEDPGMHHRCLKSWTRWAIGTSRPSITSPVVATCPAMPWDAEKRIGSRSSSSSSLSSSAKFFSKRIRSGDFTSTNVKYLGAKLVRFSIVLQHQSWSCSPYVSYHENWATFAVDQIGRMLHDVLHELVEVSKANIKKLHTVRVLWLVSSRVTLRSSIADANRCALSNW